ncbi:MAG: CPBP family intramembrane glutamic endopeptidase [Collinsella sp.]|nr:CPBP family intramembrane glutamic endopeptidase [Collinsella sp.]
MGSTFDRHDSPGMLDADDRLRGDMDASVSNDDMMRGEDAWCDASPLIDEGRLAPGDDPAAVAPTSPRFHMGRFVGWTFALFGTLVLNLVIQVVVGGFGMGMVQGFSMELGELPISEGNAFALVLIFVQVVILMVALPWWLRLRRRSLVPSHAPGSRPPASKVLRSVAGLVLMGVGIQYLIGFVLTLLTLFIPEAIAEYEELMEDAAIGVFSLLSVVSTVLFAPVVEEIFCRGIMFEFALRAVGASRPRDRATSRVPVLSSAFWAANFMQALAFGVLHMNGVQGGYAFILGLILGWVYWRTGNLWYPIALHFAVNGASFLVDPLAPVIDSLPVLPFLAVMLLIFVWGLSIFRREWADPDDPSPSPSPLRADGD